MNLQTFKATTMAEALSQVKTTLGPDAVILHTRTYQQKRWLGLRRNEVVEITAGKGAPRSPRTRPAAATPSENLPVRGLRTGAPAAAAAAVPATLADNRRQLLETPAASNALLTGLASEMNALKSMVKELTVQTRQLQAPSIPEELFDYYFQLLQNQVAEELAGDVVRAIQKTLRPEHLARPEVVAAKVAEQLERLLPIASPLNRTKPVGPHVVALIGPTGVGKTTTVAKLAAILKLRERKRVGLITIDTYRLAAVDQLQKYADIIGSSLTVVSSVDDMRRAIDAMSAMDYILIDTAGRSPNDAVKLFELKTLLATAEPDEVHLVLSSTASQPCVELAVERFSAVRVDKIIFTKLDEAAHVGVLLNVIKKVDKSLSYITTGQDVPADIEVAHAKRLAQLILQKN